MRNTETGQPITGTRCHICTGCGRCVGGGYGRLHVVTERQNQEKAEPIKSVAGERLVTADIGTTTIAMQLYAPDGTVEAEHAVVNPQTEYGADVLSRIRAAGEPETARRMQQMVRGVLEEGLSEFNGYLEPGEKMRMVLAGNTTMNYLLLGHDPAELGRAPFHASYLDGEDCGIGGVPCRIFPGLSAFVGGDIVAGMYACGMVERDEVTLLIDLGTNGEMVLGNRKRRIACATAAGPAFEGGVNRGVWGADMVRFLARLRRENIMDETGLLADAYFDEGVRIGDVCVTQNSIRAVQLAKAAIRTGIGILMQEYGFADRFEEIDRVVLAGGFGYYLNPGEAAEIGLLPAELVPVTEAGGNTVLAGALRLGRKLLAAEGGNHALFEAEGGNRKSLAAEDGNRKILARIRDTEVRNLAEHADFEKWYIQYMDFPAP